MLPYFAIAALAALFVWAGSAVGKRVPEKHRTVAVIVAYALAILTFSFFAGARDAHVGNDLTFYGIASFNAALDLGFFDFYSAGPYADWGPLIKAILWASANATQSLFWYLFAMELVFVVPTCVAIRFVLKDSGYKAIFLFGILFFPMSLNLMRQAMAMGFVLLSYVFIRRRKPIPFVVCVVVAALFHDTALVALLAYPLFLVGAWRKGNLPIKAVVLMAIMALAIIASPVVIDALGPFIGSYNGYLHGGVYGGSMGALKIAVASGALFLGLVLVYYFCRKKIDLAQTSIRQPELPGLALIVFFGAVVTAAGLIGAPLYRLGLYFLMFAILLIPMASDGIESRNARLAFDAAALVGSSAYSIGYYVLAANIHVVVPYVLAL